MAVITYLFGQMFDDSGALLTAPVCTIASVTDKAGSAIASPGATVNGSATATPISVDYDAEVKGEAWITLAVSQGGHTITGANASPVAYAARDSSRIISDLDAAVSSRSTYAGGAVASVTGNVGGNVTGTIGGYAAGQDPATLLLVTPGNKLATSAAGAVTPVGNIRKNQALANFTFPMLDATTGKMKAGLGAGVTGVVSIDGATPVALTNAVSEVTGGLGFYKVNLAAADVNGTSIGFLFTATGAQDNPISFVTAP